MRPLVCSCLSVTALLRILTRRRAEVVVAPGLDPWPTGGRAAIQPKLATFGTPTLRPALGRVLPELLPAVDSQIQQSVRRCRHFIAAAGGSAGLEDLVTIPEIADQDGISAFMSVRRGVAVGSSRAGGCCLPDGN